jgi:hypothetical protein
VHPRRASYFNLDIDILIHSKIAFLIAGALLGKPQSGSPEGMTLLASFTDLEQLVWEDIQSDGLGIASQADSDSHGTSSDSPQIVTRSNSAFLALGVEEMLSAGHSYPPSRASGDAGSGTFAAKQAQAGDPLAGKHAPSSQQPAGVGPFSALELQQRLDSAPSGCMRLPSSGALLTQRTRALAAAAGSLRTGAVGSNLRLAALMYRSNSGGLADTLLSEQARAESGLLLAGLPRSDSLPELNMPLSAAELAELATMKDLDLFASMPSAGLPSLSMLFNEPPDLSAAAHAGHQHDLAMAPASRSLLHDADTALRHAPASAWALGRMMMRPKSFTALTAPPMFGGSHAPAAAPHMGGLPPQTSGPTAGYPSALQPPTLVDYSCMVVPKEPAVGGPGQLAGPHAAAAGEEDGFPGLSLPSHSRLQPLLFERQDTFELLMRQVGQEMVHEAQVQQYAALELDTMDVPTAPLAAAAPSAVDTAVLEPAFMQPSVAEAAVPAVLAAAAAAAAGPSSKRRSVFELKRPSAFEAAAPAHLSALAGTPAAAVPAQLEPAGPSAASWAGAAPADPSTCSQVSDGSAATAAAAAAAVGAATGGLAVPTSPFCLPTSTGLLAGDSSAATDSVVEALSEAPECAPGKQEVAR